MSDFLFLLSAVVFAAFVASVTIFGSVNAVAERIFDPHPATFSAKFIKP